MERSSDGQVFRDTFKGDQPLYLALESCVFTLTCLLSWLANCSQVVVRLVGEGMFLSGEAFGGTGIRV